MPSQRATHVEVENDLHACKTSKNAFTAATLGSVLSACNEVKKQLPPQCTTHVEVKNVLKLTGVTKSKNDYAIATHDAHRSRERANYDADFATHGACNEVENILMNVTKLRYDFVAITRCYYGKDKSNSC